MIKVGIAGVTGMAGEGTLKILLGHPGVEVTYLGSEHAAGSEVGDFISDLKGVYQIKCEKIDPAVMAKKADVLMLCKEAGFGMKVAPELLKEGKKVVDLGPDFRIPDADVFEKYYGIKHTSKSLLKEAVFGLPELYKNKIAKANLVANPGCYPTGAILALAPLLKGSSILSYQSQIRCGGNLQSAISISAYSGLSGSGKKYSEVTKNLFIEAYGNLRPYNVGKHRHLPEIENVLSEIAEKEIKVSFVPHTVPIDRGILSTIFVQCKGLKNQSVKAAELVEIYKKFYKDEPFVRILPEGEVAQTQPVMHTNICEISFHFIEGTNELVIISAIDNLVKGAAGQAVQNLNIMCGLDETAGLQFRSM